MEKRPGMSHFSLNRSYSLSSAFCHLQFLLFLPKTLRSLGIGASVSSLQKKYYSKQLNHLPVIETYL